MINSQAVAIGRGTSAPTIVDVLRRRAHENPQHTAYTFLRDSGAEADRITFADLDRRAAAVAGWLQQNVPPGARALLLYPAGLDYIAAFFGCLYAGVIAVPAYPPRQSRTKRGQARLDTVMHDANVAVVLTATSASAGVEAYLTSSAVPVPWQVTSELAGEFSGSWRAPILEPDNVAFLQYTSGSTSDAKGVMVSHGNIIANEKMIRSACDHSAESTFVGWLPVYHDMGLLGNVIQPLYCGAECVLMPPSAFLQKPITWLRAISRHRGRTSGAPNFAYALCASKITDEECAGLDLSSWTVAFNGAEPVHGETMDAFARRFSPYGFKRSAFFPCYGLAEATLIVSGGPRNTPPVVNMFDRGAAGTGLVTPAAEGGLAAVSIASCGPPVRDTVIEIVSPETLERCPTGRVGEVWVSSPSVAVGYWNRPLQSEEQLRARLPDTDRTFLRTGDLGFLLEGALYITGRLRDLVIIRGRNHHPEDLEWTVRQCNADVRVEGVAAFSIDSDNEERLVIAIAVDRRDAHSIDTVAALTRAAIAGQHEIQVHDIVLVKTGALPMTSSGKVQRYLCRQAYLDGTLNVVARHSLSPTRESAAVILTRDLLTAIAPERRPAVVEHYLGNLIGRLLRTSAVSESVPLVAVGLDSLAAAEATHCIEVDLEIALPMAMLLSGVNISELAALACAQLERAQVPNVTERQDHAGAYPLSHGQKALWFIYRAGPLNTAYNLSRALDVSGRIEPESLVAAIERITALHPQLRIRFVHDGVDWMQVHDGSPAPAFVEADASNWTAEQLDEQINRDANQPFDLEHGPVMRVKLYRRACETNVLLLSAHHIVADLWSFGIIVRQLGAMLERQPPIADADPPVAHYRQFVHRQSQMLASGEGDRLWNYWKNELAHDLSPLELVAGGQRPLEQAYRGARRRFRLNADLTLRLRDLGKARGVTLYAVLMAAFQILLQRHSQTDSFLVGTPVAGRGDARFRDVVGHFINLLPVRAAVRQGSTFSGFLETVWRTIMGALAHQDYPFALMVERLQPARDPSRPPLCQVLFALQRTSSDPESAVAAIAIQQASLASIGRLQIRARELRTSSVAFDLALTMAEVGDTLDAVLEFNADLFDGSRIERFGAQLTAVLDHVSRVPETRICDCPVITRGEREEIIERWNSTRRDWDTELPVTLLEAQVRRTPHAVAVAMNDEQHSYASLDRDANRLAAQLLARGVGPDVVVGIAMERTPSMVVALLAVMKSGAAFLPIDLDYPVQRIAFMLEDARVRLVITGRQLPDELRSFECLSVTREGSDGELSPATIAHPDQLAYVLYTSGSTGTPKGVQITNRSLHNFLSSMPGLVGLGPNDSILASTSLSFDVALLELLAPLTVGARIWISRNSTATDPSRLIAAADRWQITAVQNTPTGWRLATNDGEPREQRFTILCGGEALAPDLADTLHKCGRSVQNLYGPTETTIWSATHAVSAGERTIPIGAPIANTRLYVVDAELNLAPVGALGELCIGGTGLARGYTGRPDLTAEKFVPDPFSDQGGSRLYRTGDRAYVDENGLVYFVGRNDGQVKLRGVRIELAEIELALRAQPGVADAVVVVRTNEPGDLELAAYVATHEGREVTASALLQGLSERMPSSMWPGSITFLDRLPRTLNGKLDRGSLPQPGRASHAQSSPPRTPLETVIASEWQRVLNCGPVGVDDNFFVLGGHSLLATRLVWELEDAFPTSAPMLALLLRNPTVAQFAAAIERYARPGIDLAARVRALESVQMLSDAEIAATLESASASAD